MRIMKTLGLISLGLTVMIGGMQMATAGFEPSPFLPEINKLNAMSNHLNAIQDNINKVLACPPDDMKPGTVGRLSAIDRQIYLLDASMESVVDEVLACPPDDQHDWNDVVPALTTVKDTAQGIVNTIDAYLSCPPDDIKEALDAVVQTCSLMVDNATTYIGELEAGGGDCGDYTGPDACEPPCVWDWTANICY